MSRKFSCLLACFKKKSLFLASNASSAFCFRQMKNEIHFSGIRNVGTFHILYICCFKRKWWKTNKINHEIYYYEIGNIAESQTKPVSVSVSWTVSLLLSKNILHIGNCDFRYSYHHTIIHQANQLFDRKFMHSQIESLIE